MKQIAINAGRDSRLLDHIAVLGHLLDIPLILTEEKNYELTQKYYPKTRSIYVPNDEFSLFDLAKNCELFLQCTFWDQELISFFKGLFPHLRFAYCPHGNSDKGHQQKMMEGLLRQDIVFLYGNHMIERLKMQNLWENIPPYILTGNYRFSYYMQMKSFYDEIAYQEIFSKLNPNNPTILYAPTWNDEENSTSFFAQCKRLLEQLPKHYNLILKTHPLLEEMDPAKYYAALPEKKNEENFIHITEFPPIYPLLAKTDIYLGDLSSMGYDYLYFQRPMFFFNPLQNVTSDSPSLYLHQCGLQIPESAQSDIFGFIEKNLSCFDTTMLSKQKNTADFAFSIKKTAKEMQKELQELYKKTL